MDTKEMRASNGPLPLEIISTILLLLPPKMVVQFMSVCKSWRNLIKGEKFMAQYLANSSSKDVGFILYASMQDERKMSFNLLNEKSHAQDSSLRIPFINQWKRNIRIVGSFNGVLCLSEVNFFGFSIYLCNPSIWKYRIINSSTIDMWLVTNMVLGFAYHSEVNDFKVVRIAYGTFGGDQSVGGGVRQNGNDYDARAEVYSLSTNSWKAINVASFPWYISQSSSEVLVNESVHWLARDGGIAGGEIVILAFDLGEEEFKEVILPPENEKEGGSELLEFLGVYKDLLCVFTYCPYKFGPDTENCELWVMKEYGNEESWEKLYNFDMEFGIERPLKITHSGQIIFIDGEHRVIIYPFGNHFAFALRIGAHQSSIVTFTKSLALIGEENRPIYGVESFLLPQPICSGDKDQRDEVGSN